MERKTIELDQGWEYMQTGITKLKQILEGLPEPPFDSQQYMMIYTTIYNMCTQKPPHDHLQQLYDKYREVLVEYINSTVYHAMQSQAKEAVIALIRKEREGEQIDRALLNNVLDIYVENGMGKMEKYEEDFESFMLQDTTAYSSHKASSWIHEDSCPDYMLKCEECLKKERERVTHYLHSSTGHKLYEKVQNELLVVVAKKLLENEHSGCCVLLRDNKMDDLSRMYRLYYKIPHALEPVADIFKQHVTAEGNALIKQAEDAGTNQVLIRKLIELHDKLMVYITKCFQSHTLFDKALVDAFVIFCNKTVAGKSIVELLATFCDNILKKGGSEKLTDEAIEDTLENVDILFSPCHLFWIAKVLF